MIEVLTQQEDGEPRDTRHGLFSSSPLPTIPEIRDPFKGDPTDISLQKDLAKKLTNLREKSESGMIILPKEELGEDWLRTLGIQQEAEPLLSGKDEEVPEITITISRTNLPEVFLKTQTRMKKGSTDVAIFRSLLIQKDQPTSI